MFLERVDATVWVAEKFYVFDSGNQFVYIKIDVLVEYQFSIEYKSQVFPQIIGL